MKGARPLLGLNMNATSEKTIQLGLLRGPKQAA